MGTKKLRSTLVKYSILQPKHTAAAAAAAAVCVPQSLGRARLQLLSLLLHSYCAIACKPAVSGTVLVDECTVYMMSVCSVVECSVSFFGRLIVCRLGVCTCVPVFLWFGRVFGFSLYKISISKKTS